MSYIDVGVHSLADSGAYGDMPNDLYLRKIQATPYPEDPDQIDRHIRTLLTDFRPDDPNLAFEAPRDPSDRGGGPHSNQFLNLRHYGTFGDESDPYLPDGSFTDHEFTQRDDRGIAIGPDMRKHMEQQYARSAFIKMYDDSDYSVPETGINPVKMVANIKSGMNQYKDRWKNFDESMDSWHNGGIAQQGRPWGVTTDNYETDGVIKDLVDMTQGNRRDAVSMLSGDPTIGYRYTVPDHRMKIAHYGFVRANQDKNYQNWNNNRSSSFVDHAYMAVVDGELVNRELAKLIVDLQGQRNIREKVVQGGGFNESSVNQQARKKLDVSDIYKIMQIGGVISQGKAPHAEFEGMRVAKYGNLPMNNNRELVKNVQVNHEILNSMQQANKKLKERDIKDLREAIAKSAADNGIYKIANNKSTVKEGLTNNQTRNVSDPRYIEAQKTTKNYAGIKPSNLMKNKLANMNGEDFVSDSKMRGAHLQNHTSKRKLAKDTRQEQEAQNELENFKNPPRSRHNDNYRQNFYTTDFENPEEYQQMREIEAQNGY
jgi:hypothetical protein